jgi:polyisoprenoid-binding protein YceI
MNGNFTMRGVTKPVTLQMTLDPHGNQHGTVYADMSFDRREFGMTYKMPFNRISDSVRVRFDLDVQGTPATGTATRVSQ